VDEVRFRDVQAALATQEREARWWRDASVLYFQTFSRMAIPSGYEAPAHALDYYLRLKCPADPSRPACDAI
jgi:alpha-glucuronidase